MPWTLGEETAPNATKAIFRIECLTCDASSELVDNESAPVELWALEHTGRNVSHRQFKLYTEWFMRVDPAPGNPLYDREKETGPPRQAP
ncbi:hypothetical protein [Streptomyces sp. B6B3]|uniref:DUF7848 domain-containing protein n=1 Tax=Streptomyces sp. B6B3 TaxID=3153570 RepID=UPI00325DA698